MEFKRAMQVRCREQCSREYVTRLLDRHVCVGSLFLSRVHLAEIAVTKQEEGSGQVEWVHCFLSSFVLCTFIRHLAGPVPGEPSRKSKVDVEILEFVGIQFARPVALAHSMPTPQKNEAPVS